MTSPIRLLIVLVCAGLPISLHAEAAQLEKISLPDGFEIEVYVDQVENARQMALGDQGTLFVGSRGAGKVHAIVDTDHDGRHDSVQVIASGLNMPSGLTFHQGALYVAEVNRILRFARIEENPGDLAEPDVVYDQLPDDRHHGWKFIDFGPDGELYIPIGAPCNVCDEAGYALIKRVNLETGAATVVARGVRNSVGFAFHPISAELYFTDNGRDWMGDDAPDCELNHVSEEGQHFGFPYIHQGDLPDPEFGANHNPDDYRGPLVRLGPHVAPLGMMFYQGDQFPASYRNDMIIAEHGSWNRSNKIGYRLRRVSLDEQGQATTSTFAEGWLQGEEAWGRPVDVLEMPDGSILVSDDAGNRIYRISYSSG